MLFAGRIHVEPVRFPRLPRHPFHRLALAVDDVERSSLERDDRPSMIVMMEHQRLIRQDDGLPHHDLIVFELRLASCLRRLLQRTDGHTGREDHCP